MTDGTEKWSPEQYFYVSSHNGIASEPMRFFMWEGLQDDTKEHIKRARQTWYVAMSSNKISINGPTTSTNEFTSVSDNVNRITAIKIDNENYLMLTRSYRNSSGKCIEADININKKWKWANSAQPDHYDIQSVITHEFGHVLGLSDKYDSWASEWVMYGHGETNSISKRVLNGYDISNLMSLYS